jgi:hypothetical protein
MAPKKWGQEMEISSASVGFTAEARWSALHKGEAVLFA